MSASYKPENYNSVSPYLVVNGAGATIDFLVDVFGAIELRRFSGDAGKVKHAEVRLDDRPLNRAALGAAVPADPGEHTVTVVRGDTTIASSTVRPPRSDR